MSKKALSKSEQKRINTLKEDKKMNTGGIQTYGKWEAVKEDDKLNVTFKQSSAPLTGITYRSLPGDKVIVTGFYGFLTLKEIEQQYGEDVLGVYEENDYRVVLQYDHEGEERLRVYDSEIDDDDCDIWDIYVGEVFSKKEFSEIIALVKKCGKYLHDLKLAMKSEEKVIGI